MLLELGLRPEANSFLYIPLPPAALRLCVTPSRLLKLGSRANTGKAMQCFCHSGGTAHLGKIPVAIVTTQSRLRTPGPRKPMSPCDFLWSFLRCHFPVFPVGSLTYGKRFQLRIKLNQSLPEAQGLLGLQVPGKHKSHHQGSTASQQGLFPFCVT